MRSTPPVMPRWKGGSDFRLFIPVILARRQDCLLSGKGADCSWGDKWRDLDWSPSSWLRSQLPPFSQPLWILSFETPRVSSREAGDLVHSSTGLGSDSDWWSWVLDVTGSSCSACYKKARIQDQTHHNQASVQKDGKRKRMPQIMETFWKHLCKYRNMWFQLHQESGKHLSTAEKPEPKVKGTILTFYSLWSSHWSHPGWRTLKQVNEVICSTHFSPSHRGFITLEEALCFVLSSPSELLVSVPWKLPTSQGPAQCRLTHHFQALSAGFITSSALETLISPWTHNLSYCHTILCLTSS